jgi:hypothetical protein
LNLPLAFTVFRKLTPMNHPIKEREKSRGPAGSSPQWKSDGAEQSERWLKEGLKTAGLEKKDLRALKGSDPRKLVLAELLWKRTTVSQEWLAEKLSMRSAANVSQQFCEVWIERKQWARCRRKCGAFRLASGPLKRKSV